MNLIGQDIGKAANGVRTVSLRISGTALDKKTLQELGEDVDDFAIKTTSKTDSDIRALTSVASNNYKGVSVLDNKGNLRSTYDILLDIADVYDEIQAEDKVKGTNRSSALLETLAGKSRANIAASILANPETLRQVKAQSETMAAGYADRNLAIYNESMEAAQQRFSNAATQLAYNAIKPDEVSGIMDLGSTALKGLSGVIGTVGTIPTLVGTVLGITAGKTGGLTSAFSDLSGKMFSNLFTYTPKTEELASFFSGATMTANLKGYADSIKAQGGIVPQEVEDFYTLYGEDKSIGQAFKGWGSGSGQVIGLADRTFSPSNALKSIGSTVLSSVVSSVAIAGAGWLIGEGIQLVQDQIHKEEIKQAKGQEARSTISNLYQDYASKESYVDNNIDDYLELRKGVSISNGEIKNQKLSNEEYSRFLSMNNELVDLFPGLTKEYDKQGNAILNLSDDTQIANETIEDALEQYRIIASYNIGEELPTAVAGTFSRINQLSGDYDKQENNLNKLQDLQSALTDTFDPKALSAVGIAEDFSSFMYDPSITDEVSVKANRAIGDAFSKAAISELGIAPEITEGGVFVDTSFFNEYEMNNFKEAFASNLSGYITENVSEGINETSTLMLKDDQEIKAEWNNLVPSLINSMSLYDSYRSLGDSTIGNQLQQIIRDDIANLDPTSLTEDERNKFIDNPRKYLRSNFIDPIVGLVTDENGDISESALKDINELLNPDENKSVAQVFKSTRDILEDFAGRDPNKQMDLMNLLGIDMSQWTKELKDVSDVTGIGIDTLTDTLTMPELHRAVEMINSSDTWSFGGNKTASDLKDYVNNVDNTATKINSSFASILDDASSDDGLQKTTDNIQAITSAVQGYKDTIASGTFKPSDLVDMIQGNKELADTIENLGDTQSILKGLDKYQLNSLKQFGNQYRGLTADVNQDIANGYIQSLYSGIDFSQFSNEMLRESIASSIHDLAYEGASNATTEEELSHMAQDEYSMLNKVQGLSDLDLQGIASLLLQGNTLEQAFEQLDAYQALVKQNQSGDDLVKYQNQLQNNSSAMALQQALQSRTEAMKGYLTDSDYNAILAIDRANQEAYAGIEGIEKDRFDDTRQKWIDSGQKDAGTEFDAYQNAMKSYNEARTNSINADLQALQDQKNQIYAKTAESKNLLATQQQSTNDLMSNANRLMDQGLEVSQDLANQIAQGYHGQAQTMMGLYNDTMAIANDYESEQNKILSEADRVNLRSEALGYLESSYEAQKAVTQSKTLGFQSQISALQNDMTELNASATELSNQMTLDSGKGLNPTIQQYGKLLLNADKQLDNLKAQNRYYEAMRDIALADNQIGLANDWQSAIDANNSSMVTLMGNMQNYQDSQMAYYENIGKSGLSAITNALSESYSATGISYENMKALVGQYSNLEGIDPANIFKATAEGVKLDVNATKALTEAEHRLMTNDLTSRIEKQNDLLKTQADLYDNTTDAATRQQIAQNMQEGYKSLGQMYNQMAHYEAEYQQQQEALSDYNQWQNATQTANQGAKYTAIQGYADDYKKLYEDHMWGTDDFKSFTQMMDIWGRDSAEAYSDVSKKMNRYFTEDTIDGVLNFMEDLSNAGFGDYDSSTGKFDLKLTNMNDVMDKLGVTMPILDAMFGHMSDLGIDNQFVSDSLQGTLKTQESGGKLADLILRRNMAEAGGASQDVIDEFDSQIKAEQTALGNWIENTSDVAYQETHSLTRDLEGAVKSINDINKEMEGITNESARQGMRNSIQDIASQYGIPLNSDGTVDTATLKGMYGDLSEAGKYVSNAQNESLGVFTGAIESALEGSEAVDKFTSSLIQMGDSGKDVTTLQDSLNQLGYTLESDGQFGSVTASVVKQFQEANDLVADGIVGAKTIEALNTALGEGVSTPATEYAGVTQFDAMTMSAEQLTQKITELNSARELLANNPTATTQMDQLLSATQNQLQVQQQLEDLTTVGGYSLDDIATNGAVQQEIQVKYNLDDSGLEALTSTAEAQSIKVKVETEMESGTTLDELAGLSDEELSVKLGIDASGVDQARSVIDSLQSENAEIHAQMVVDQASIPELPDVQQRVQQVVEQADVSEPEALTQEIMQVVQEADISQPETLEQEILQVVTEAGVENPETLTQQIIQEVQPVDIPEVPDQTATVSIQQSGDVDIPESGTREIIVNITTNGEVGDIPESGTRDIIVNVTQSGNVEDIPESGTREIVVNISQSGDVDIPESGSRSINVEISQSGDIDVPEDVNANVNYSLGSQAEPQDGNANVNYALGGQDDPQDGTASVYYSLGGQDMPADGTAAVNYVLGSQQAPAAMTATVNYVIGSVQTPSTGTSSATGTMAMASGSIGRALASGTVSDKDFEELSNSFARGSKVTVGRNQDALVNEVGNESIIRDGVWSIIPGGMHIEHLRKNDIILSHTQTEDLLHHGSAKGHGKVIGNGSAFASGTVHNGMSAFAIGSNDFSGTLKKVGSTSSSGSSTTYTDSNYSTNSGDIYVYNGDNSGNNYDVPIDDEYNRIDPDADYYTGDGLDDPRDGEDSSTGSKDSKYAYETMDYVVIRLQYFANKTKEIADKITNYVSSAMKERLLNKQIERTQDEIKVNSRAANAYIQKASEIANEFKYTDDDGKKQTVKLTDKFNLKDLISGKYDLTDYETTTKQEEAYVNAAKQYTEYINKANSANMAVQTLSNSMADLQNQILQIPIDDLSKSLEKINNKLKTFSALEGAMSSGASGIAAVQRIFNEIIGNDKVYTKAAKTQAKVDRNEDVISSYTKKSQKDTKAVKKSGKGLINNISDYLDSYSEVPSEMKADYKYIKKQVNSQSKIKKKKLNSELASLMKEQISEYNNNLLILAEDNAQIEIATMDLKSAKKANQKAQTNLDLVDMPSSMKSVLSADTTIPSYITQNAIIDKELKQSEKTVKKNFNALKKEADLYKDLNADNETNQKNLEKYQNKLSKNKSLTKAQRKAIKKGNTIDSTQVPEDLSASVAEYNKLALATENTSTSLKTAKENMAKLKEETAQSVAELAEKEQEAFNKRISNISNYFSVTESYYQTLANKISTSLSLAKELGREVDETGKYINNIKNEDIKKEIKDLQKVRDAQLKSADEQEAALKKAVKDDTIIKGSEEWLKEKEAINKLRTEAIKTEIEIDKLYDSIIDNNLKRYEDLNHELEVTIQRSQTLRGLINSDMMYTKDGDFTELGIASLSLQIYEYEDNQATITNTIKEMDKLTKYYEKGQLSAEEYNEKMESLQDRANTALTNENNMRQTIINSVVDRYKTEIAWINELIDARKKEIQKQKEMYDYDKNLKKQNKEIEFIDQQLRALESLDDQESRAMKARLEAERAERQEELDDTIVEHVTDLRIDNLDELSDNLQKNLEQFTKDLQINIDSVVSLINDTAANVRPLVDQTNTTLSNFLKSFNKYLSLSDLGMPELTTDDLTVQGKKTAKAAGKLTHYDNNLSEAENAYWESVKVSQSNISTDVATIADILKGKGKGYASGTRSASGGLTKVNENGPETIVTKSGVFIPLSPGDGVIPSGLTSNLIKMAQNGMNKTLKETAFKVPDVKTTNNVSNVSTFENLLNITVEGNLDSSVIPQIEEIAKGLQANKGFMQGVYQYTSKSMSKDLRKVR